MYSRKKLYRLQICRRLMILILIHASLINHFSPVVTQSVGYHPNINMGFNPYMSPVYGYGMGLPYGSYGYSIMRNPKLALASMDTYQPNPNSWLGKLHTNSFLKKSYPLSLYPYHGGLKNKLTLFKHPEYAFTPYGYDYGYGKHYGAAMLANNPYKSPYKDYYHNEPMVAEPSMVQSTTKHFHDPDKYAHQSIEPIADSSMIRSHSIIKPLVKAGVLLTTAALLGKKTLGGPLRLNPSGMILSGRPDM